MKRLSRIAMTALFFGGACIGCASPVELQDSTLESSAVQLRAAVRAGFPTRVVAYDERLDADEALAREGARDPAVTYLVLSRTDAKIAWAASLAENPPSSEKAILGRWVVPYLRAGDRDNALKSFVFGYLLALHEAGRIEWDEALVPILPPGSLRPRFYTWGLAVSFLVMILVIWAARRLS